jgi:hypothetical protein
MIGPFRPEFGPPQPAADGDTCTDCQRPIPGGAPVRADGRGQLVHDTPCGPGPAEPPPAAIELPEALQHWRGTLSKASAALNTFAAVPTDELCRAVLATAAEHAREAAGLLTTLEGARSADPSVTDRQQQTAHLRDLVGREQQRRAANVTSTKPGASLAAMRASPGRRE